MKKLTTMLLVLLCLLGMFGCNATDETNLSKMEDLEKWVSDEWSLITDFNISYINVDTIDSPKHENNLLMIKASYIDNGELVSKSFTFEITYDEFLTLYDNNGHIVYNTEEENGNVVTDINSKSLNILQKYLSEAIGHIGN